MSLIQSLKLKVRKSKKVASVKKDLEPKIQNQKIIAIAGNPNVGKSTVFNALTGMNQHTGNWPGKTVDCASGKYKHKNAEFKLVDIPGTYSLTANSPEEEIARDFICSENLDAVIVVVDATCLERNLNLVLQILKVTQKVVVCANLIDEAKRKKIKIDIDELSLQLGVPVVATNARSKIGLKDLMDAVHGVSSGKIKTFIVKNNYEVESENSIEEITHNKIAKALIKKSERIYNLCVKIENHSYDSTDRKIDKLLTSKLTGFPIMILMLIGIFWITISGANYPSELIASGLFWLQDKILNFLVNTGSPPWFYGIFILGVYRTLAWVVSVMLPPMAIFFPLFTLLEDVGYLPRVAFNLDNVFKKSGAHGKQSLTMCMGFGCNACGIIGCRIIDSPRERLIAILTNNFVPCNGRFPLLISIITMFFVGGVVNFFHSFLLAIILTSVIIFGIIMTFLTSKILSETILKGVSSSFILELPPYRRPQLGKVIIRSIFDRTIFVLGRAVAVAAPAGFIIWIMANIQINNLSVLAHCSDFLDPFAKLIGLDGIILLAFILAFPANEIVFPIIIMSYMCTGSILELESPLQLHNLLASHGWTYITAICVMLFSLMHFPCGTTCLTIKKETGSLKWTALAFIIPTVLGVLTCFIVSHALKFVELFI